MRRPLFLFLLVAALGVWGWALWRTGWWRGGSPAATRRIQAKLVESTAGQDVGRDPFRGPWTPSDQVPVPKKTRSTHAASKPPVPVGPPIPAPILKGFLGGDPPMAILESNGKTEMVHPGSSVFGWNVIAVGSSGVDVERDGQKKHLQP